MVHKAFQVPTSTFALTNDDDLDDPGLAQEAMALEPFRVTLDDYFDSACPRKYLHFFNQLNNELYVTECERSINSYKADFSKMVFGAFSLPPYSKSIITPQGDIFLMGGVNPMNEGRLNTVFSVDFGKRSLRSQTLLITARSSFGACYLNGHIYAVGGLISTSTPSFVS